MSGPGKWLLACLLALAMAPPAMGREKVTIQPLGEMETVFLQWVEKAISRRFDLEVKIAPAVELPEFAYYAPRKRYRADKLLVHLDSLEDAHWGKVIGITQSDISITKGNVSDWGIFGYSYAPGRVCVVSTYRLRHGHAGQKLFLQRLERVALHELGHTFGLLHCSDPKCLMADAKGSIKTVDESNGEFCPLCAKKLGTALKKTVFKAQKGQRNIVTSNEEKQ